MRVGRLLLATLAVGGVPLACLLALVIGGAASPAPALLAMLGVAVAAFVVAVVWALDMERLAETLQHAAREQTPVPATPRMPTAERLARGIERLSRTLAARTAQVTELLRANEAIIERLPDPLLVLGADRGIRRANAAAHAAFGADMAAVLRHPEMRAAIEHAYTGRAPHSAELTLPVPTQREVRISVIPFDPPLADGGHAIALLSDRTRERAVERMRADFVANASHELRTPLASLMGFIETLRGPAADDPPAQQRFLGIMAEQAERMNRLIDDLMSLSRIELTEHQPPAEQVLLPPLARRIADGFEPRLEARRMTLHIDIENNLPAITADADQLEQVLTNLLDNAIKYGAEAGTIRLGVAAAPAGATWPARPGVLLSVVDDGPGIPRAQVPRLTERFYRVDQGRARQPGNRQSGTGLGLAIIKHIVNRHRGQLVIDSDTGSGASFTVWLPIGDGLGG